MEHCASNLENAFFQRLYNTANDYANLKVDLDGIFKGVRTGSAKKFMDDMEKRMPVYLHEKDRLIRKYLERSTAARYIKAAVISDSASK